MPLRDHFRPPLADRRSWEGVQGQWPAMIVLALSRRLPRRYVAEPQVHLGPFVAIDVATYEEDEAGSPEAVGADDGGLATATWAPPRPTMAVATDLPDADEYEVRVYDTRAGRRLVAAVELVSPANKDRPEHRAAFVGKCAALLQDRVSEAIVDLVTVRSANLYHELLRTIGRPALVPATASATYAVACRTVDLGRAWRLDAWEHPLALGAPLPTVPLWLAEDRAIPLDLERSYEATCRALRLV